jgi:ABC-type multidrug transport system fused ATPase/permease subunit
VIKKWIGMQGGAPLVFYLFVVMTVWAVTKAGVPWFLQFWSSREEEYDGDKSRDLREFLALYACLNAISISCDYIRTTLVFRGNWRLSRELNFLMTFRLMHASVNKFFDRVPLGRILNRFLKDVQVVDSSLGWSTTFLTSIL